MLLKNIHKERVVVYTKNGGAVLEVGATIEESKVLNAKRLLTIGHLAKVCEECYADGKTPSEEDCKKCAKEEKVEEPIEKTVETKVEEPIEEPAKPKAKAPKCTPKAKVVEK